MVVTSKPVAVHMGVTSQEAMDPDPHSYNPALPSVVFVEWEGYKGKNFQTEYIVGIYKLFDQLQVLPHLDGMELIHLGFLLFL
jgi:hypothetical protein